MNKLAIGENIWRLRKLKKITQEQLGEYIGVSKGAISKWESGISYPDIELLPVLARFFGISIDELLNFNSKISKELEEEIYLECNNAINEDNAEKGIELCKSYLTKYTNNYEFKFKLVALMSMGCAFLKNEDKIKRVYGKIINIYEDIVTNSVNEELIELSKLQLSLYYSIFEEYDKSLQILENMRTQVCNINVMKANIYMQKNDLNMSRRLYQGAFLDNMLETQEILYNLALSYYKEDIKLAEKYMKLRLGINKLSDENTFNGVFEHYIKLSEFYAYHKDKDKCLNAIKKATECINNRNIKEVWYLDQINLDEYRNFSNQSNKILSALLNKEEYSFLEDDEDFMDLSNKIKNLKYILRKRDTNDRNK